MSKSLGRVERAVLQLLLAGKPIAPWSALSLTSDLDIWSNEYATGAPYSAVRRALATLLRKGLVECGERHCGDRRRHWWLSQAGHSRAILERGYGEFTFDAETSRLSLRPMNNDETHPGRLREAVAMIGDRQRLSRLLGYRSATSLWQAEAGQINFPGDTVAWLERYAAFYEAFRQAEAEWLRNNPPLRPQRPLRHVKQPPGALALPRTSAGPHEASG